MEQPSVPLAKAKLGPRETVPLTDLNQLREMMAEPGPMKFETEQNQAVQSQMPPQTPRIMNPESDEVRASAANAAPLNFNANTNNMDTIIGTLLAMRSSVRPQMSRVPRIVRVLPVTKY